MNEELENEIRKDTEHLKRMYNRLINVHHENSNLDYMLEMNAVIVRAEARDTDFIAYLKYVQEKKDK
tara:strand:+ start:1437 stop:1637 length:201 start_codon:yes stop_codon:yes gene_type:complete